MTQLEGEEERRWGVVKTVQRCCGHPSTGSLMGNAAALQGGVSVSGCALASSYTSVPAPLSAPSGFNSLVTCLLFLLQFESLALSVCPYYFLSCSQISGLP